MRRLYLWGIVSGAIACLMQPTLVAITPDYGFVDGCMDVTISGHDLGSSATARLVGAGGEADMSLVPAERDPKRPDHAQDIGFIYYGVVPPSPDLQPGWYDLVVTVEGEDLTLKDGWYYASCPGIFHVQGYTVPPDATVDSRIDFQGCGLRDGVALQFLRMDDASVAATAELAPDCGGAQVHVNVPAGLEPGTYSMQLVAPDGTTFVLQTCSHDSGDTGGATCVPDVVTVGGAR